MKIARTVLFVFLLLVSISSYLYLDAKTPDVVSATNLEDAEQVDEITPTLPDVEVMKKVYEAGKRFLPVSSK